MIPLCKQVKKQIDTNTTNINANSTNITNRTIKRLYYNSNAANTSVTLSDAISNYTVIVVVGQSSDGYQCSTTLYSPSSGSQFVLVAPSITSGTTIYNKQAVYKFSSTTALASTQNYQLVGNTTISSGSYIKIRAVYGVKSVQS